MASTKFCYAQCAVQTRDGDHARHARQLRLDLGVSRRIRSANTACSLVRPRSIVVRAVPNEDDKAFLERLLRESAGPDAEEAYSETSDGGIWVMRNLPLWRVQWACAPGMLELLHIHVPHYTHMFRQIFSGPMPWRFGHIYLPEGSKNLGSEDYALRPGTKAPLTGVLMEVVKAVEMSDGRLLIFAVGVARIRVRSVLREGPYSVAAEAEALVDDDVAAAFAPKAAQMLMAAAKDGNVAQDVSRLAQASKVVQRSMAAASLRGWAEEFELKDHRGAASLEQSHQSGLESVAALAGEAGVFSPLPLSRGNSRVLGVDAPKAPGNIRMVNVSDEGLEEVTMDDLSPGPRPLDLREVSENVATRAESAGAEAAEAVVTEMGAGGPAEVGEGRRFGSMGVPGAGGWPFQLNTLMERGLRVSLGEEGSDGALADTSAVLGAIGVHAYRGDEMRQAIMEAEARVWEELDAVVALLVKLRGGEQALPRAVECLRPRETCRGEGGVGADPEYDPLQRAWRLSFAVLSLMDETSPDEGRQAWLETNGVIARLNLAAHMFAKHRSMLAAMSAVQGVIDSEDDGGSDRRDM